MMCLARNLLSRFYGALVLALPLVIVVLVAA